jgi:hypothetical protein
VWGQPPRVHGAAGDQAGLRCCNMAMSEPSQPIPPNPEDFGLTADRLQFFGSHEAARNTHSSWLLIVACLCVLGAAYVGSRSPTPILNVGSILIGCLAAWGLFASAREALTDWIKVNRRKRARDYQQFLSFQAADIKYREEISATYARREEEHALHKRLEREEWQLRKDKARRQAAWWRSLSGHQFEKELYEVFKLRGYDVRLTGFRGADRGIDMVIKARQKTIIVQCKAHRHYLSAGPVRELYGTLIHEKEQGRASEAWLVSATGFYSGAKDFAFGKPIRLLTILEILEKHEVHFL